MASTNLTVLLDLRRAAEEEAKRVLAEAVAALGHAEAEQARLEAVVKQAEQVLTAKNPGTPSGAAEGLAREHYRQRMLAQRERAQAQAKHHRNGALRRARLAESAAAESLRQISQERQAAERLCEHQKAEQRKQAQRRDEQRDDDWARAIGHQRKPR